MDYEKLLEDLLYVKEHLDENEIDEAQERLDFVVDELKIFVKNQG